MLSSRRLGSRHEAHVPGRHIMMQTQPTLCSYCKGTGGCHKCKGAGTFDFSGGWFLSKRAVVCGACHGLGKCELCHGSGSARRIGSNARRASAAESADSRPQLLIARMRIYRGRQRACMPRKPLRQEQVPAGPVNVGHGGVAEGVERVEAVESGLHLPRPEGELDAALADADAGLGAKEGISGL